MRFLLALFCFSTLNTQSITFENPEVYELVNVAFALTDFALEDANMTDTSSVYFKEVRAEFGRFSQHPLVQRLDREVRQNYRFYLETRTSSIGYVFNQNDEIDYVSQFGWERNVNYYMTFGRGRRAWADFAQQIGFRRFYTQHQDFYRQMLERAEADLNVPKMQTWLESEFTNKYDAYEIVISPLVYQSHLTFRYEKGNQNHCRMFISPPSSLPFYGSSTRTKGIYTGIVFTEIDHNYINLVSDRYASEIRRIFRNRAYWVDENGTDVRFYESPLKVFNEYMTHATYLLWVYQEFSKADADFIAERRFRLMHRRGYKRFREFHQTLSQIYQQRGNQTLTALYPDILESVKE